MSEVKTNVAVENNEEMPVIRITVLGEERETKADPKKKFWTYKAVTKNGALVDLKFRQEVANVPKEKKFIIVVSPDMINEARNTYYPTWWVAGVIAFESWEANLANNRKRVNDVFGDLGESDE